MTRGVKPEFDEWRMSVRLTEEQEQLILGSTLGNMSIMRNIHRSNGLPSEYARVGVSHVEANKDYVDWKYSILGDLVGTPVQCRIVNQSFPSLPTFKNPTMCDFRTFSLPALRPLHDLCYSDGGKRRITREWMEALDHPIALAAWFMDSGTPVRSSWHIPYRVQFTVPRTDYSGAEIVRTVFLQEGCGFEPVHLVQDISLNRIKAPHGHQMLTLAKREDIRAFVNLVESYVRQVPSMMWKIEPLLEI